MRRCSIALVAMLALGWGAIEAGLRYNGSASYPVGLYLSRNRIAHRGDLVFVNAVSPVFDLARRRGYLDVISGPAGHLLKRLAAVAGDLVSIDSGGVEVNGVCLPNSAPLPRDGARRPLAPYIMKGYILRPGEVLVMSDYNPRSYDSRYFGPIPATAIESVLRPLWTWR